MNYIGEISALSTAVLWSATSLFFSEASQKVGSLQVNIMRLLLATIYLAITIIVLNLSLNLSFMQILNLTISGIIGLIFGDTYLFKAFQHIGPRISMLVMSLAPAIAAILAYFFLGEGISWLGIAGIIITLSGISIVVLQREEHPTSKYKISKIGILYAFFGAVGQGVGLIFAKLAFNEGEIHSFVATFIRIFSSVIILLPLSIMSRKFQNPIRVFAKDKKAFGFTTAGSICGPYLGITLSLVAISNTSIGIAATLMAIVPILLLPMVKIFYKEKLSWKSITGAFISVGGIAVLFLR
jgi:drug/metabolite transporter (DMT)-like permease